MSAKEKSYNFSKDIILFINKLDRKIYSNEVIGRQLLRSATSIGANIIEAQAGSSKKDFGNFLSHALKSANETKYWLELLNETSRDEVEIKKLLQDVTGLSKILAASILTIRGKR